MAGSLFLSALESSLLLIVGLYRSLGTAFFGGSCRFEPSCSTYAAQALQLHSPWRALKLIGWRLARCQPFGQCGYDPVPDQSGIPS